MGVRQKQFTLTVVPLRRCVFDGRDSRIFLAKAHAKQHGPDLKTSKQGVDVDVAGVLF